MTVHCQNQCILLVFPPRDDFFLWIQVRKIQRTALFCDTLFLFSSFLFLPSLLLYPPLGRWFLSLHLYLTITTTTMVCLSLRRPLILLQSLQIIACCIKFTFPLRGAPTASSRFETPPKTKPGTVAKHIEHINHTKRKENTHSYCFSSKRRRSQNNRFHSKKRFPISVYISFFIR